MTELPKAYIAKDVEHKWYEFWEKNNFFTADNQSSKPSFTIVMPPPNVTGSLHMGHALVNTLQDILIRFKRMSGFEALWVPGTDHAGIATQTVVERHLLQTKGKRRVDFSRKEFLEEVWKWKEKSETNIISQLKRQGASCDWQRLRFTMDEANNKAVRVIFKRLFDKGLIYRGDYLVNWDPVTQTALADDEVEYEEKSGYLWYFAYPLSDKSGSITIATTRPETMLGDTAVAVNPKDSRYQALIGKTITLPLSKRKIPIIADESVDMTFGTGAVKITPAHDHNDYQMALRHNLPMINIMTHDGKVNENGGSFASLTFEEARRAVIEAMQTDCKLIKQEPYVTRIGVSYRSKAIIEPHLSKQWFVKMSAFKDILRKAVEKESVEIIPEQWKATYFHWIDNLRDWCISRQLWWGHQIPIWYHKQDPDRVICYDGIDLPSEVQNHPDVWQRDPDVLDTWFSSALWPFSTLGWPDNTADLSKFYPNNILVTGHDILFFWVARMLMMGVAATKEVPFPVVFLHGLIYGKSYWREEKNGGIAYVSPEERKEYDLGKPLPKGVHSKWEKMSKSKGNIIDPNEIINEYGADAMRMALAQAATSNPQIDLDRRRFEEFKNFANKVWNGARFVLMNIGDLTPQEFASGINLKSLELEDRWILAKLQQIIQSVTQDLNNYRFDSATTKAYNFFWDEFCAYYVEIVKPTLTGKIGDTAQKKNKQKLLLIVLSQAIRLLHPMAPFITEELFQLIKTRFAIEEDTKIDLFTKETLQALSSPACIKAPFPKELSFKYGDAIEDFERISQIIYTLRNIRGQMQLPPHMATDVYLFGKQADLVKKEAYIIKTLVRIETIHFKKPPQVTGSSAIVNSIELFIPMPEELMAQEKIRLQKEETKLAEQIEKLTLQLKNPSFIERAPPALVQKQQENLAAMQKELVSLRLRLHQ